MIQWANAGASSSLLAKAAGVLAKKTFYDQVHWKRNKKQLLNKHPMNHDILRTVQVLGDESDKSQQKKRISWKENI